MDTLERGIYLHKRVEEILKGNTKPYKYKTPKLNNGYWADLLKILFPDENTPLNKILNEIPANYKVLEEVKRLTE